MPFKVIIHFIINKTRTSLRYELTISYQGFNIYIWFSGWMVAAELFYFPKLLINFYQTAF